VGSRQRRQTRKCPGDGFAKRNDIIGLSVVYWLRRTAALVTIHDVSVGLRVIGVNPVVLLVLADRLLEGAEGLTPCIADLSDDLILAEGAFSTEVNQ
jgi:hypothetical protein